MSRYIVLATAILLANFQEATAQKRFKTTAVKEIKFLENIEVDLGSSPNAATVKVNNSKFPINAVSKTSTVSTNTAAAKGTYKEGDGSIEKANELQLKYALLLDAEVESVKNLSLLQTIEEWWGTKYRIGGNDKTGVDCSGFTHALYSSLYATNLPRTSREQFGLLKPVDLKDMHEGDLVFFSVNGSITHVGFYLQNNRFVHASTSEGVMISSLNEPYWSKRFAGAGRYDASLAVNPSKP